MLLTQCGLQSFFYLLFRMFIQEVRSLHVHNHTSADFIVSRKQVERIISGSGGFGCGIGDNYRSLWAISLARNRD